MIKNIILIIGASGSGKTSLVSKYIAEHKNSVMIESYTTREIRPSEIDDIKNNIPCGHLFVNWKYKLEDVSDTNIQTFEHNGNIIDNSYENVLATTYINNQHYFCTREQLNSEFYGRDDIDTLFYVVDVKGAKEIRKRINNTQTIFLSCSREIRIDRMLKRQSDINITKSRVEHDDKNFDLIQTNFAINVDKDIQKCYNIFSDTVTLCQEANN